MLGELSYAISLTLPLSQQPSTVYGKVQQESYEAQRLLAALSPQQQSLITAEMANDDTPQGRNRLARTCLGSEFELLKSLPHFMAQTELDDEHMQALFCLGNFTPPALAACCNAFDSSARQGGDRYQRQGHRTGY